MPQRYEPAPISPYAKTMLVCASLTFIACLTLLAAALFGDPPSYGPARRYPAIFSVLTAALACWYAMRRNRRLPQMALLSDEDGLWPAQQDKNAAILRWQDIVDISCLRGSGKAKVTLHSRTATRDIAINPRLSHTDELLTELALRAPQKTPASRYHMLDIDWVDVTACLLLMAWLAFQRAPWQLNLLLFPLCIGLLGYLLLNRYHQLDIDPQQGVTLRRRRKNTTYPWENIARIAFEHPAAPKRLSNWPDWPDVVIHLRQGPPVVLKGFGGDKPPYDPLSLDLYRALHSGWQAAQASRPV